MSMPPVPETFPETFREGPIEGVLWKPLMRHHDGRGWLCELFRQDELPAEFHPAMAYLSISLPGITRGPHEHVAQADCFCFLGPSTFALYLWDRRVQSSTYGHKQVKYVGAKQPTLVVIPPGVVHAYKNVGEEEGMVLNCPNRLYRGVGKAEPIDEIRWEERTGHPFRVEEVEELPEH